ncbi:MAG: hypothetical protein A2017_07570 [Lentisphaerae bacterium GWF2_44_16]|nr:MAG: hypothetical protein A2017_07570 [Lentisphaerae bacterium GWF2_44_16]
MKPRICNYNEIFIKADGTVYPCCRLWFRDEYKIGHVTDADIAEKILSFYKPCKCELFVFRKPLPEEKYDFKRFNIETSMFCQAKCAMCCTKSPDYSGRADSPYLEYWIKLIDRLKPRSLTLQGGEVLVQKKTIQCLKTIKEKYPEMKLHCVSNMSVDASRIDELEYIFDGFDISMVGFQHETYDAIMGLDIERTRKTIEELLRRKKQTIMIKYLLVPLNVHEVSAWLQWCIDSGAESLQIAYASGWEWVKADTQYGFWSKIFDRASAKLKKTLIKNFKEGNAAGRLSFEKNAAEFLSVSREFAEENSLSGISCIGGNLPEKKDIRSHVSSSGTVRMEKHILPAFSDYYILLSEKYISVYIYGAGLIGRCLLDFIKDKSLPGPAAIIDDYCKESSVGGIQVKKAVDVLFKKQDAVLLATDTYSREFTDNLNKLSCPASIKNISNFIKEV